MKRIMGVAAAMSLSACYNNKVEGTKEFGTWRM